MSHTETGRREQGGTRIGYTRVSTVSQTIDQQNEALAAANVTKTFSDIMSGARDDRPGLAALMEYIREGDTVVVWKLDRLARNSSGRRRVQTAPSSDVRAWSTMLRTSPPRGA
jgi:DNA invertase Pin-like site-specific DNA recombinase